MLCYVLFWVGNGQCYPYPSLGFTLTHWVRDKTAGIFQTTFSNAFSWMKMHKFRLWFHSNLFPRLQLTIYCFRLWLGADQVDFIYGCRSSNESQRLDDMTGYQDSGPSNGQQRWHASLILFKMFQFIIWIVEPVLRKSHYEWQATP